MKQHPAHDALSPASIAPGELDVELASTLRDQVWGQGFEAPTFCDEVQVLQQRLVGDKHLKLRLRHAGDVREGIWFNHVEPLAERDALVAALAAKQAQVNALIAERDAMRQNAEHEAREIAGLKMEIVQVREAYAEMAELAAVKLGGWDVEIDPA